MTPIIAFICVMAMLWLFLPSQDTTMEICPHCKDFVYMRKARINCCPTCKKVFV